MIRQFEQTDLNILIPFMEQQRDTIGGSGYAEGHIPQAVEFIKKWTMVPSSIIYIDEQAGKIKGYAVAQYMTIPWSGNKVCNLNILYVAPEHRQGHTANGLYDAVEYWAKQNDCQAVINTVMMYDSEYQPQQDFIDNAHSFFSRKMTECGKCYVKEIV